MAHMVDSMFYNTNADGTGRFKPWHGLGTPVDNALTSKEAIVAAGLDWKVKLAEGFMKTEDGLLLPANAMITYRSDTNAPLGVVSDKYACLQNEEAFEFTDELIGNSDAKYDTAGSLEGGRRIWLLAKMPNTQLLGDEIEHYICFTTSHDGGSSVRVICTNVRVVCNNTLMMALNGAHRSWSCVHRGTLKERLEEAKHTLFMSQKYNESFKKEAERLAKLKISPAVMQDYLNYMFRVEEDDDNITERRAKNMITLRNNFMSAYNEEDLDNHRHTAWGLLNAASDFISHYKPLRQSKNHQEKVFLSFINGNKFLDTTYDFINAMAA